MDLTGIQTYWLQKRGLPTLRSGAPREVVKERLLKHLINHPNDLPGFQPNYRHNLETVKAALRDALGGKAVVNIDSAEVLPVETDEEITVRWGKKLTSYERMVQSVVDQKLRALSVFGNGGFGKTYIAMTALQRKYQEFEHNGLDLHWKWIKGGVSA